MANTGTGVSLYPSFAQPAGAAETVNLSSGLVYYWDFQEATGATRAEKVAGVKNLTDAGSVPAAVGKNGNCAAFADGGDTLSNAAVTFDATACTISFWMKRSVNSVHIEWTGGLTMSLAIIFGGANLGPPPATDGAWHHVLVWASGSTAYCSLDGGEPTSAPYTAPTPGALNLNDTGDGGAWSIDEMGVWTRALNASERAALYNSGTGTFYPFS